MTDARYTMGIDLGQTRNYTAMVVMEHVWQAATPQEFIASGTRGYQGEYRHTLVRAERVSLGTPYPKIVEWVKTIAKEYGDQLTIVVDASGVGSAVVDALRRAGQINRGGDYGESGESAGAGCGDDGGRVLHGVAGGVADGYADGGAGSAV